MPTNNPVSNLAFNTWLSPNQSNSSFEGLLLAQYLKGGYQTVTTLDDRDALPIYNEGAVAVHSGFTNSGDGGKTTGRRSLGMMVHVIDPEGDGSVLPKTYVLLPLGYFGNGGILGWDSWTQLPEWEKAKRMKPSATVYSQAFPSSIEFTLPEAQVEDDCWVELIQFTEHPLPAGGSAGEVLVKIDADDHNVAWAPVPQDTSQAFRIDVSNGVFESGGVSQPSFLMLAGHRYQILQITPSNVGHPIKLSNTPDGTHGGGSEYTTGVTYMGTAGTDGVLTIDVTINTPAQLYYYCENHPNMGGTINVSTIHEFYSGNFNTHLIPDTNATYDIGSAEKKIRHLYLSDNSIYFGVDDVPLNSSKVLNTLNFSLDPVPPSDYFDPAGGVKGDIRFDLQFMYICTEAGQWKRVALDNTWNP